MSGEIENPDGDSLPDVSGANKQVALDDRPNSDKSAISSNQSADKTTEQVEREGIKDEELPGAGAGVGELPGVLGMIRGIREGTVNPRHLRAEDRRLCVEHLSGEGVAIVEIAAVLKVSERTVRRDRQAVLQEHALTPSTELASEYAGRLQMEMERSMTNIRRIARDKGVAPSTRIEGERACIEILDRCVQRLQSMGILPLATQRHEADVTHHIGELSIESMQSELDRLNFIEADAGSSVEVVGKDDGARPIQKEFA